MLGVNETGFLVPHESCECKCGLDESICNSNQKGIMMKVGVSVKNYMIGVLVKMINYGILVHIIVNVIRQLKLISI